MYFVVLETLSKCPVCVSLTIKPDCATLSLVTYKDTGSPGSEVVDFVLKFIKR